MAMKIGNTLFLIIFLLCAGIQYNDPDAFVWIPVYLAAAVMCAMELRQKPEIWPPRVLLALTLVGIIALVPSIVGKVSLEEVVASVGMKTLEIEEAREIGGLCLIAIWATAIIYHQRLRSKRRRRRLRSR